MFHEKMIQGITGNDIEIDVGLEKTSKTSKTK